MAENLHYSQPIPELPVPDIGELSEPTRFFQRHRERLALLTGVGLVATIGLLYPSSPVEAAPVVAATSPPPGTETSYEWTRGSCEIKGSKYTASFYVRKNKVPAKRAPAFVADSGFIVETAVSGKEPVTSFRYTWWHFAGGITLSELGPEVHPNARSWVSPFNPNYKPWNATHDIDTGSIDISGRIATAKGSCKFDDFWVKRIL